MFFCVGYQTVIIWLYRIGNGNSLNKKPHYDFAIHNEVTHEKT